MTTLDELDELFHWCSLVVFLQVANAQQGWSESEAVRQEAYRLYERELAEKNAQSGG